VALDILTICIFFFGCLCLFPKRMEPRKGIWWLDPVVLLIACGLLLGVGHGLAMVFSDTYSARVIAFYHSLGITATKEKAQPAPTSPSPRPIPKPSPFPKNLNPPPPPPP